MFEKYTEKARRAIFFARYEASQFGVPFIDTEHLLLGLVREDPPLMKRLLLGDPADEIRAAIEKRGGPREKIPASADLPLSNESRRVLVYAFEESTALSHPHVGTEHLLLGLLREERTLAWEFLLQRGLKLASVRKLASVLARQHAAEQSSESLPKKQSPEGLEDFCVDVDAQAAGRGLSPLIGREDELQQLMRALCCRGRSNVVLLGEAGVGKRTLVRGLSARIAEGRVPDDLAGKSVIAVDLMQIVSGMESRRLFEENLRNILGGLRSRGSSMILLADDLHALAVSRPECLLVANVLKAAILDQTIRCISTCTRENYRKAIEKERWLEQMFKTVEVEPLDPAQALEVLMAVQGHYEAFHEVVYSDEALRYSVFHSHNYILNRFLPEKAIDLMDEAGAHAKIRRSPEAPEIAEARVRLRQSAHSHETALVAEEFEKARFYAEEVNTRRGELQDLLQRHGIPEKETITVTRGDVDEIVSQWTGISPDKVRASRIPEQK